MVLFADPAEAVEGYERAWRARLVLHGSARHLVSPQGPVTVEPPPMSVVRSGAGGGYDGGGNSAGTWFAGYVARRITTEAGHLLPALAERPAPTEDAPAPTAPVGTLALGTRQLLTALDAEVGVATAAWMRGYARVTADLTNGPGRYVVASPLYVEYAPDLP
jgi:hypothetical protein